jgi:hypothetical protein
VGPEASRKNAEELIRVIECYNASADADVSRTRDTNSNKREQAERYTACRTVKRKVEVVQKQAMHTISKASIWINTATLQLELNLPLLQVRLGRQLLLTARD